MKTTLAHHVEADDPTPAVRLGGTAGDIPMVDLDGEYGRLTVSLAGHRNPHTYLREWAARLVGLAEQIEAKVL